ncbi:AMP-binding protein [Limibacter armeniacum]|uniref:AMP-binding protein n=1 Tax=Limibacter armeniacum TaxID=466084 RepID=UPI002FE5F97C
MTKRLTQLLEESVKSNWEFKALEDYKGKSYTYGELGETITKIHSAFRELGVEQGDKIALMGKNSANWCTIYLATVTYGAVIVPVLPDFKADDTHHIVNHSDAKVLFIEKNIFAGLSPEKMTNIEVIFSIKDFGLLESTKEGLGQSIFEIGATRFASDFSGGVNAANLMFHYADPEALAVISYTSGTTGFSKGVMIQHKSLSGNVVFAQNNMPLQPKDKIVSFLPLAHTYGCAFEFLFPLTLGCHITLLTKTPSPQVVLSAFQEVKPSLILTVPLVIEKIFKSKIQPELRKPMISKLIKIPGLRNLVFNKIRKGVYESFGGNFKELVIGGAAFNPEVEAFFNKIKFPFTVGYGMTECGPLISYASWNTTKLGASGRPVDEVEVKIDSDNQREVVGEIMVKGSHVMKGYYKNPEATEKVLDNDGWFRTGDLGVIDHEGNIFIKGRSKSMILGPSGKNIYPEELESLLNNSQYITESIVIDKNNKLVALIYPDFEVVDKNNLSQDQLSDLLKKEVKAINHRVPGYMTISDFKISPTEFEKTPKRSIKRFMYQA